MSASTNTAAGPAAHVIARRLDAVRGWLARVPLSALQLGMRLGVGMVFFNAGLIKYRSWEFTIRLFAEEYRVPLVAPELAARLVMAIELTIPLLLFAGLATRLATLPLLGMILVIQTFVYPQAWAEHLLWGSVLTFILTHGPGRLSLDAAIARIAASHFPAALPDGLARE